MTFQGHDYGPSEPAPELEPERKPKRRVRCAQCRNLTRPEYLNAAGLCECCTYQPPLFEVP
jgi:hypothetical protein